MGRLYLLQHVIYCYNRKQERNVYEIYVTDRLKAINDSLAQYVGGVTAAMRYADILESMTQKEPVEERTAEQVISSISEKLERLKS